MTNLANSASSSSPSKEDPSMEHNRKSFPAFNLKIQSSNVNTFEGAAKKFAIWLGHHKAYYAEARPYIVQILESAHNNICTIQGNPSEPFTLQKMTPELVRWQQPYIDMLGVAARHFHTFQEPGLKQRLIELFHNAGVNPNTYPIPTTGLSITPQASASHILAAPPSSPVAPSAMPPRGPGMIHTNTGEHGNPSTFIANQHHNIPPTSISTTTQLPPSDIRTNVSSATGPPGPKKKKKKKKDLSFTDFMQVDLDWYKQKQTGRATDTAPTNAGNAEPQTPFVTAQIPDANVVPGSVTATSNESGHLPAPAEEDEVVPMQVDPVKDKDNGSIPPATEVAGRPDEIEEKLPGALAANVSSNLETQETIRGSEHNTLDPAVDTVPPATSEITESPAFEQTDQILKVNLAVISDNATEEIAQPEVISSDKGRPAVNKAKHIRSPEPVSQATVTENLSHKNDSSVSEAGEHLEAQATTDHSHLVDASEDVPKPTDDACKQPEAVDDQPPTTPSLDSDQIVPGNADSQQTARGDLLNLAIDTGQRSNMGSTSNAKSASPNATFHASDNDTLGTLCGGMLTTTVVGKRLRSAEDDGEEFATDRKLRRIDPLDTSIGQSMAGPEVPAEPKRELSKGPQIASPIDAEPSRKVFLSLPSGWGEEIRRSTPASNSSDMVLDDNDTYPLRLLPLSSGVNSVSRDPFANETESMNPPPNPQPVGSAYQSTAPATSGLSMSESAPEQSMDLPAWTSLQRETSEDASERDELMEDTPPEVINSVDDPLPALTNDHSQRSTVVAQSTNATVPAISTTLVPSCTFPATQIRTLLVARGSSGPGDENLSFYMNTNQIARIAAWMNRTYDQSDLSETLCLSLACYRFEDAFSLISHEENQEDKDVVPFDKLVFNSGIRCCWPSSVRAWIIINDDRTCGVHMPPYIRTADDFVDISASARSGTNIVQIHHQNDLDMSAYVFAIFLHSPTPAQFSTFRAKQNLPLEWTGLMQKMTELPRFPKLNWDTGSMDAC